MFDDFIVVGTRFSRKIPHHSSRDVQLKHTVAHVLRTFVIVHIVQQIIIFAWWQNINLSECSNFRLHSRLPVSSERLSALVEKKMIIQNNTIFSLEGRTQCKAQSSFADFQKRKRPNFQRTVRGKNSRNCSEAERCLCKLHKRYLGSVKMPRILFQTASRVHMFAYVLRFEIRK